MLKTVLVFLLAVLGPAAAVAEDKVAQDLLHEAARKTALLESSSKPFVMDVDFTAQFDAPLQGHLRLRWEAKDRWWSKVTMGLYEAVWFQNGDKSYLLRTVNMTPVQIHDLFSLIHVAQDYGKLTAHKEKDHVRDGVRLQCVDAGQSGPSREEYEICMDAGTHLVVSETRKYHSNSRRTQFSDYAEFEGYQYPRKLESEMNGNVTVTAKVIELKEATLDPKLLVPPEGAIERRECDDKIPPVLLKSEPDLTGGAVGMKGKVTLEITVLADGSVGDVSVVQSGGKAMDDAVINGLKHAKFKPAMCGTEPVVGDVHFTVEFNFKTY